MDHSLNLAAVFGLYRETIPSAAHGDQIILKHGTDGRRIDHGVQLTVNPFIGQFDGTAHMF